MNCTALVPVEGSDVATPCRLDLREMLLHWLDFRFETVRRRFLFDLEALRARIHLLEGFEIIFDCLDEAIAIIRASEGKRDAAEKLMERFELSEEQTDAILELRLYKLARLEILLIREELAEKREEADRIAAILASDKELWNVIRGELTELRNLYATPRRTIIGAPVKELAYEADLYIVKEDAFVVVTRGGWFKRQSSFTALEKIRVRDGDEIGWLVRAHTRSTLTLFTSGGGAYVLRVDDVPATTGYGEPVQARFALADGERVVGVISHDERNRLPAPVEPAPEAADSPDPPWGIALTRRGRVLRFALSSHEEVSTKSGRRYARLVEGDGVLCVYPTDGTERVCLATTGGRAMVFNAADAPILKAAGRGVTGIKLRDADRVLAFELATTSLEGPKVVTAQGRELVVRERKFGQSPRGGKGKVVLQRGTIDTWIRGPVVQVGGPDDELVAEEEDAD